MSDIYAENHQLDPDPALETVSITRAQHEALMMATKLIAATPLWRDHYADAWSDRIVSPPNVTVEDVCSARAALRAAGLEAALSGKDRPNDD